MIAPKTKVLVYLGNLVPVSTLGVTAEAEATFWRSLIAKILDIEEGDVAVEYIVNGNPKADYKPMLTIIISPEHFTHAHLTKLDNIQDVLACEVTAKFGISS